MVFSMDPKAFISYRLKSTNNSGHRGEEALFLGLVNIKSCIL